MTSVFGFLFFASLTGLTLFGFLGYVTLVMHARQRKPQAALPVEFGISTDDLPAVTVQLPVYNESLVIEELIQTVAKLAYPKDRLQIQILDDSKDVTTQIAAACVRHQRTKGLDIQLLHRKHRKGFKAGALEEGLRQSKGDLIAVFDADFRPPIDFLMRIVPYFSANPKLALVQTRWIFRNEGESFLTGAQAIALDKHFEIEQRTRYNFDYFPKFNGSSGVWRKTSLVESGGWRGDTVCEDLCMSLRAKLRGWDFLFLPDIAVPTELPRSFLAYRDQQARWAHGSVQCLLKYWRLILQDSRRSLWGRIYTLVSMSGYVTSALSLALLLTLVPLVEQWDGLGNYLALCLLLGFGQPLTFIKASHLLHGDWLNRLRFLPALLLLGIGITPALTQAVLLSLMKRGSEFVRTPKGEGAQKVYGVKNKWMTLVEIALAFYSGAGVYLCAVRGSYFLLLIFIVCLMAFSYVSLLGLWELMALWRSPGGFNVDRSRTSPKVGARSR